MSTEPTDAGHEPVVISLPSRIGSGLRVWLAAVALIGIASAMIFYRAMGQGLNHDEQQFLAPGVLYAWNHSLPYRDYPLFHLPNLVFIYGWATKLTEDLVFGPKLVSVFSTIGVIVLLFGTALARTGNALRPLERLWIATCAAILLLFDPLYLFTSGKTWNHELPAFLLVLAMVLHLESLRRRSLKYAAVSGLAAGLAVGTRLTFAPPCIAFIVHLALWTEEGWRGRLRMAVAWGGGCLLALAPTLYFFSEHREAFLFDNLTFPRISLLDPENTRVQKTVRWAHKLRYLVKEVLSRSWPLALLYFASGVVPVYQAARSRRLHGSGAGFSILLGLFALAGCFAPSRYQYQHFYVLVVIAAMGIIYRCKEGVLGYWERRVLMVGAGALAALSLFGYLSESRASGWKAYLEARAMRDPSLWFCNRYRAQNAVLERYVPAGERVLTLAPTAVLSGERQIYPEFATGTFAWRGSRWVAPEQRQRYHFVAPEDLSAFLQSKPPAGILTGMDDESLEVPFIQYAEANGYRKVDLPKNRTLWVKGGGRVGEPGAATPGPP